MINVRRKVYDGSIIWEYEFSYDCINTLGFAKVIEYKDYVELRYINVDREYRGNGIGSTLLNHIIEEFPDKDIIVETFKERINWYSKFQFHVEKTNGNLIHMRLSR
ncbi:MAG: GNAT family N-acetyltransferase [Candidatus Asgardarchaeia archaeon]